MSTRRTRISDYRFSILLAAILGLILVAPALEQVRGGRILSLIAGAGIPLAAIYSVSDSPRHMRIAVALLLPSVAANLAWQAADTPALRWMSLIFPFFFYAYTTWIVGVAVFGSRRVTIDTLSGAACVYMLLGALWWKLYKALSWIEPASFAGSGWVEADGAAQQASLLYFSFVTLTSLGFGDIAPATSQARALVIVEAVTGVLYIAIVIARLIGLYMVALSRD